MSVENVKKFYEAVTKDEALKQQFVELSQKYQGQPMDEAKALAAMEQEALPLAKQLGYEFTIDDLKAYEVEMQQAGMNNELSDSELQAVVGGDGTLLVCVVFGFGDKWGTTGFCCLIGIGGYNRQTAACVAVGVGIFR